MTPIRSSVSRPVTGAGAGSPTAREMNRAVAAGASDAGVMEARSSSRPRRFRLRFVEAAWSADIGVFSW